MNKNTKNIPKVGEFYHFFDDGKLSSSRHYICKCEKIIPFNEFKNIHFTSENSLYDIWESQINDYDWLYAKETDYAIICSCPKYDENDLYFVRTIDGGWFSIDIQSAWQSGRLDITSEIFNKIIDDINQSGGNLKSYTTQTY